MSVKRYDDLTSVELIRLARIHLHKMTELEQIDSMVRARVMTKAQAERAKKLIAEKEAKKESTGDSSST